MVKGGHLFALKSQVTANLAQKSLICCGKSSICLYLLYQIITYFLRSLQFGGMSSEEEL